MATSSLGSHAWQVSNASADGGAKLIAYLTGIKNDSAISACKVTLHNWTKSALLAAPPSRVRVVEVGSGLGEDLSATHALLADGETAVGLEPNQDLLAESQRRNVAPQKVRFESLRGEEASCVAEPATVAVVRIERVLQHLPIDAIDAILESCVRVLHPEHGRLICCEPNW
jgi:ubiquinone/menaquinone biosynthesis C-methylase UbiE